MAAEYRLKLDDLINQTDVCVEHFKEYQKDVCSSIDDLSKRSKDALGYISNMTSTCKREIDILQDRLASEVKLNDDHHNGFRQVLKEIKDKMHRLRHKKELLLSYKDTHKVDVFVQAYDDLMKEKTNILDNNAYKAACLNEEKVAFAEKEALMTFENVLRTTENEIKSCRITRYMQPSYRI